MPAGPGSFGRPGIHSARACVIPVGWPAATSGCSQSAPASSPVGRGAGADCRPGLFLGGGRVAQRAQGAVTVGADDRVAAMEINVFMDQRREPGADLR